MSIDVQAQPDPFAIRPGEIAVDLPASFDAGLYFIGEAVDVTGWLGGYNFQWAWASGVACGKAL